MDTSIERIRAKIADLEQKIADLRIAERELNALNGSASGSTSGAATGAKAGATARKPRSASPKSAPVAAPAPTPAPAPAKRGRKKAAAGGPRQTIGAAINDVLDAQGPLSAADISEQIKSGGREITNRMVSFALQAMKKRSLVKNVDGKWSLTKPRAK